MNINKTEKLMIEKLKRLPAEDLARLLFNYIGVNETNLDLLTDAIPTKAYNLPSREFRRHFEMLEYVCFITGLQFWRDYAFFKAGHITASEMSATCLALNDVIQHFKIEPSKAQIMGLEAFYAELSEKQNSIDIHCPDRRKAVFNEITAGAEALLR